MPKTRSCIVMGSGENDRNDSAVFGFTSARFSSLPLNEVHAQRGKESSEGPDSFTACSVVDPLKQEEEEEQDELLEDEAVVSGVVRQLLSDFGSGLSES